MRLAVAKMYKLFIGGKFTRTESERYSKAVSPVTGKTICNISRASRKDIRNSAVAARPGFNDWSSKSGYERSQILYRMAEMLEERTEQFSNSVHISTGISAAKSIKEVKECIDRIIFFAGLADKWQQLTGTVNPVQQGYFNFSISEPSGIVGIILPEAPALLPAVSRICNSLVTGNSCIVIASERSPLPVLTLAEVIATSDFPSGVINILTGRKSELIPHLAGHFDVNAIDYCDNDISMKKEIQLLCANNVKRFHSAGMNMNWSSIRSNENLQEPERFTEIKTVWHTMGL
ncbi:MAG: aldehyde dehydrogenase family protein [Ignavibacteria bacterium]|nr:aldehyde dehydrogenase family protein [Ignavibacteria bacterium]